MPQSLEPTKLYHSEVFMPEEFKTPVFRGVLRYGPHSLKEATTDRYGEIPLPIEFHPEGARLIESEVRVIGINARVIKQLWRKPLDETRDLVMAITDSGYVKTVWVNLRSDTHRTLNRSRYVRF